MEPRYDIKEVESRIYKMWEESGLFNPDVCVEKGFTESDAEPFAVSLPPPNVTGTLHMGHAFEDTVQDIVVRFARMKGKKTLWIPGTDHAASATPVKVENEIYKKEGKSRHDLGRDEFLRRVNLFAQESHDTIVRQVRRMGASLDWSREAYTLDEKRNFAVRTAFEMMYDMGLIYRGNRIVHWDPKLQTTISDDEVEWLEETIPLYYLKYGPFVIATARPETKFGDKYVVMHPDDKRYSNYKDGQKIDLEWINGPITATVVKDNAIDMAFGTGVMTITPWHDLIDFDIAERHGLDVEQVIDLHGKLLPIAGEFAGMHIKKARPLIVEKLKHKGLVEKTEEKYLHRIATNSRGGGVIEPQIMRQWFVAVDKKFTLPHSKIPGVKSGAATTLKALMRHAVDKGSVTILPERFQKVYFHWIDNLRDWCISRQIWFGHRIPVWYCARCGEPHVNAKVHGRWTIVRHGETDWNKERRTQGQADTSLNDIGREQIRKVAKVLASRKIDLVISSDLARARETGEIIARETGAELIIEPRFKERGFGVVEGMLYEERNEKHGDLYETYDKAYEKGETFEEVEKRAVEALLHHKGNHAHKNVVITTHGGTILTLRKHIKNLMPEEMFDTPVVENGYMLEFEIGDPCKKCGGDFYEQDPDTLDTWFSSATWTFTTLGWPERTKDLATYHPNAFMAPGYEILFFWVARMILMSTCLLGEIPFRTVYLHGIVRDGQGRKFSKSLGNGVDPLVLADTYGADAVRMSLVVGAAPGNDVKFSEPQVRGYRNFSTKIWNIARFIQMNRPASAASAGGGSAEREEAKELAALKSEVTKNIEEYDFHLAAEKLYHYVWHTLADKIVEQEKPKLRDGSDAEKAASYALLEHLLLGSLTMLHPFMPFITEEAYGIFRPGKTLMVERWD